jgi:hypothetical protein
VRHAGYKNHVVPSIRERDTPKARFLPPLDRQDAGDFVRGGADYENALTGIYRMGKVDL